MELSSPVAGLVSMSNERSGYIKGFFSWLLEWLISKGGVRSGQLVCLLVRSNSPRLLDVKYEVLTAMSQKTELLTFKTCSTYYIKTVVFLKLSFAVRFELEGTFHWEQKSFALTSAFSMWLNGDCLLAVSKKYSIRGTQYHSITLQKMTAKCFQNSGCRWQILVDIFIGRIVHRIE
jgi:hypothetical protein